MENLLSLFSPEKLPIDFVMIILVLLGGLFQRKYLTEVPLNAALKTLIVSTLFCLIFIFLKVLTNAIKDDDLIRWFFSYVVATSMYELLMKKLVYKYFPEDDKTDADAKR